MEIGEISLLSIVTAVAPMALFVLLALFAPLVYRRIAGKLIEKFRPHQPQWISIILDSYLSPTTILLRTVFIYAALWVLPLELNTPTYRSVLARIMQGNSHCIRADLCIRTEQFFQICTQRFNFFARDIIGDTDRKLPHWFTAELRAN